MPPLTDRLKGYSPEREEPGKALAGGKKLMERIETFMGNHPEVTVAAALAFGLALGWMIKRK